MKLNRLPELQRREFLRRTSALGLAGTAAPWALSLAGIGEALLGGKPSAVINAQLERGQRPRLGEACPGDDAER